MAKKPPDSEGLRARPERRRNRSVQAHLHRTGGGENDPVNKGGERKVEHVNGTAVWWTDRPSVYANRRLPSMPTAAGGARVRPV